jgi:hypothetical protein
MYYYRSVIIGLTDGASVDGFHCEWVNEKQMSDVSAMKREERNKIGYTVACIGEFARATGLGAREAFRYLHNHGGIDFLMEYYDTEHLLSFEDAVDDLKIVTRKSGGMIA